MLAVAYEASLHWFSPSSSCCSFTFFLYLLHPPPSFSTLSTLEVSPSPSFTLYQEWCAVLFCSADLCSSPLFSEVPWSPRPGNCPCWMDPEAPRSSLCSPHWLVFIQCLLFQTHRVLYESRAWSCLGHFGYLSLALCLIQRRSLLSLRGSWWQTGWKEFRKVSVMVKLRSHLHLAVLSLWKNQL